MHLFTFGAETFASGKIREIKVFNRCVKIQQGRYRDCGDNKEKYITFNIKIDVKLLGVTYKDKSVYKKVQLRSIDSCRFTFSSLDRLTSNLCGKGQVTFDCKMEMLIVNTSSKRSLLEEGKKCKLKKNSMEKY